MEWTEDLVLELISKVHFWECLWNPKDKDKRTRGKVKDALKAISDEMDIDVDEVKNKKDNLFQTYRNYRRKVTLSAKAGGTVYKPSWVYYDVLDTFLHSVYTPVKKKFQTDEGEGWLDQECHNSEDDIKPFITDTEILDETWNSPPPKKTKQDFCVDGRFGYIETIERIQPDSNKRDECSLYGELLAIRLRKIEENKRQLVMHVIDNIMFEAISNQQSDPPVLMSYLNRLHSKVNSGI
ncbi:hypothetical protein JTB14_008456 [Gonioctena quinquepunctata]|nr:hypothetical protein JTB14_008456 [Gonioctena quinquepunctata]